MTGAGLFTREYRHAMATVSSRQALREAVNEKLGAATWRIFELQQAELPEQNKYQNPKQSVVDFLHAAHGVVPVIKTFAVERLQHEKDFEDWRSRWEATLTDGERGLWLRMLDERVAQEHGEGAGLEGISIPITYGGGYQDFTNYAALGIERPPGPSKGGVQFRAYTGRPASDVCRQYLELVQRFWRDFQADHGWLMAS